MGIPKAEAITPEVGGQGAAAQRLAEARGQTLAQMAVAWILRQPAVTSVLVGASRVAQIEDNVGALANLAFTAEELTQIDAIAAE